MTPPPLFGGDPLDVPAIVLIYSGGLKPLQTVFIVGAFPFCFVMFLLLAEYRRSGKQRTFER